MLKLDNIVKVYETAGENVDALRGISLGFRESEFVAVLGHSGCGKTTLLNIVGGLDQYTSGDLIINGRSTKEFKDRDWDTYRNHSVGFVFQSYNLIPHQSVLSNVELALTLSGVSKADRRRRAAQALEKVGLADQMKKRPNQLSGGQMQRVAIARALVNDPDILLADEPTGALDSETSVQVMDLLKEIARDKLVIMVTHNPELAQQYATRIIRLKDGRVVDDSAPFSGEESLPAQAAAQKKPSMSFFTAFSLSLNNLMTKKGRTLLTSFAGSIGIIGIALILSLSSGIQSYIDQVQEDTLSSYPITIQAESVDMSAMMSSLMGARQESAAVEREEGMVYSSTVMYDMINAMTSAETQTNNLKDFRAYLEREGNEIASLATIQYGYDAKFDIYIQDEGGKIIKSDVTALLEDAMGAMYGGDYSSYFSTMGSMYQQMDVWEELLPGENGETVSPMLEKQYDVLYGRWPEGYDEVMLFVSGNNELSDMMLYALGLLPSGAMADAMNAAMAGGQVETEVRAWRYEELCDMSFKLLLPAEYYQLDPITGAYTDLSATETGLDFLYGSDDVGTRLKVVGVARANEEATSTMVTGALGYTSALTSHVIEAVEKMDIVKKQMKDQTVDVFTGLPFATEEDTEPTAAEKREAIRSHLLTLPAGERAAAYTDVMCQPTQEYVQSIVRQQTEGMTRESIEEMIVAQYASAMGVDQQTVSSYIAGMDDEKLFAQVGEAIAQSVREQYAQAMSARLSAMSAGELAGLLELSMDDTGDPAIPKMAVQPLTEEQYVYLYDNYMPPTTSQATYEENMKKLGYVDMLSPSSISIYASTFADKDQIAELISQYNSDVAEEDEISYTDYVALLMSSITGIISGISYLLIAFVSISLVVSSIMIGIITYISVLERTKEIGVLRAVGASKRDVSRVFNAETLIVGLGAGLIGIGVTALLIIPINAILLHFTGIEGLKAVLPLGGAVVLVAISALLTIVAGLIPARVAAKKDPVEALRTE